MKNWKKAALVLLVAVAAGVAVLYGCLSSEWFLKKKVLPMVGRKIGQPVAAERIRFSLFSGMEVEDLTVGSGADPLLQADIVRVRYRLARVFRGELAVDEILLDGVKLQMIQSGQERSSLPPAAQEKPAAAQKTASKKGGAGLPLKPVVCNVRIRNAGVVFRQDGSAGLPPVGFSLRNFNLELPEFRLDHPAELTFTGNIRFQQGSDIELKNATLNGIIGLEIDSALQPRNVRLTVRLEQLAGRVRDIGLDGRAVAADFMLTGGDNRFELQQLYLAESFSGSEEAALKVSGSGTFSPLTADLSVHAGPVQPSVLNLAGALAGGLNFGKTVVEYQGAVRLRANEQVESSGKLYVRDASVSSPAFKQPLPPLNLNLDYALAADLKAQTVQVDRLQAEVRENGKELAALSLSHPLTVSLAPAGNGVRAEPASVRLSVKRFSLLPVNAFLPPEKGIQLTGGELSTEMNVEIADLGRQIQARGTLDLPGLGFDGPSGRVRELAIRGEFDAAQRPQTGIELRRVDFSAARSGQRFAQLGVSGLVHVKPSGPVADLKIVSEILDLEPLMALAAAAAAPAAPAAPATSRPASAAVPAQKSAPASASPQVALLPVTEPPAVDFKGLDVTAGFRFDRIVYRQVQIAPLSGALRVQDNKVALVPLDLTLNGTPVRMQLNADLGRPGYLYEVHAAAGALDLTPIIQSTVPVAYRNSATVALKSLQLDAKGAGITAANLSRNADIHFKLETGTVELNRLPFQEMAAAVLSLPDLNRIRLDQGVILLNSVSGGLSLDGTRVSGADVLMTAQGTVGYDERLNLRLTPGAGGRLETRLQSLPAGVLFSERSGGYLMAPVLTYPVTGTIRQPHLPGVGKFLQDALADAVKTHGQRILKDAAGQLMQGGKIDAKELLKGLPKPPPAEAPATAPRPAPAPSKSQEQQLIEAGSALLEGFLKKKQP